MADSVDRILTRYQSSGFENIIKEQQTLAEQYEKTDAAQEKVNQSSGKLENRLSKLSTFGRNLRQAGGFLGNDTIAAAGDLADGMGDISESIDTMIKKGGGLGKFAAGLTAVLGGLTAGASIYDATIGKLQGTNTGTILDQLGKFAQAGFNQNTLRENMAGELSAMRFQIQSAQIDATNAVFNFKESLLKQPQAVTGAINSILGGYSSIPLIGGAFKPLSGAASSANNALQQQAALNSIFGGIGNQVSNAQSLGQAMLKLQTGKAGADNRYGAGLLYLEQEIGKQRTQIVKSYSADLTSIDLQYYSQRQKLAANYGVEAERAEEDHQKSMRRLQQDHDGRLRKLAESRDALGIEDENEQYNKERQRAEEDFNDAARRRSQDYANQLRELEQAHNDQLNERKRQYQDELTSLRQYAEQKRQEEYKQYLLDVQAMMKAFEDARVQYVQSIPTSTTNNTGVTVNQNFGNTPTDPAQLKSMFYGVVTEIFHLAGLQ